MNKLTFTTALISAAVQAASAPRGVNIGGNGTGRGVAQAYALAGSEKSDISLRVNFYDKDVGDELDW